MQRCIVQIIGDSVVVDVIVARIVVAVVILVDGQDPVAVIVVIEVVWNPVTVSIKQSRLAVSIDKNVFFIGENQVTVVVIVYKIGNAVIVGVVVCEVSV